MPWSVLIRLLAGIVMLRAVRGRSRSGATPAQRRRPDARRLLEDARLGWRIVVMAVLVAASVLLLMAGVSTTLLGPRWLGVAVLVVMVVFLGSALAEMRAVLRLQRLRQSRRHAEQLRREV